MIQYSKNVVGCRISNQVFVHPELHKYPRLYRAILKHENNHTDGWSVKDLKNDLFGTGLGHVKGEFYRFMFTHPRTFLSYFPISKVGKYWALDAQLTLVWVFALAIAYFVGVNL